MHVGAFTHIDDILVLDKCAEHLEERAQIGQLGANIQHEIETTVVVGLLEVFKPFAVLLQVDMEMIGVESEDCFVVLADLVPRNHLHHDVLVFSVALVVEQSQNTQEVHQLRLVKRLDIKVISSIDNKIDELSNLALGGEQALIIAVHLPKELHAAHIVPQMPVKGGQILLQLALVLPVVPDQQGQEVVGCVQGLCRQGFALVRVAYYVDELDYYQVVVLRHYQRLVQRVVHVFLARYRVDALALVVLVHIVFLLKWVQVLKRIQPQILLILLISAHLHRQRQKPQQLYNPTILNLTALFPNQVLMRTIMVSQLSRQNIKISQRKQSCADNSPILRKSFEIALRYQNDIAECMQHLFALAIDPAQNRDRVLEEADVLVVADLE
jgi:hypothetical protein